MTPPRHPRRRLLRTAAGLLALPLPACAAADRAATAFARPELLALPPGARLRPLGALRLDTAAHDLGGLSGLHLSPDLRLTAVSDRGRWMTARLLLEGDRVLGLDDLRSGPLRDTTGRPYPRGGAADAEALARLPDGSFLVGFERRHRIQHYAAGLDGAARLVPPPQGLGLSPRNGGAEALAVLPDGRWLLITERLAPPDAPDLRRAWIGRPGGWEALAWRPAEGMDPVDAAVLPDGGLLVLERGFSWLGGFTGRLVRLPAAALAAARAGSVLAGAEEWLRIEPPLPVDNYEGVAAARVGGRTIILLVSDDNESTMQQSWLLVLALPPG